MSKRIFTKDFTLQEPISPEALRAATSIMESGRLFRYNTLPGEAGEASLLETEFAAWMGKKYCLACTSCGSSMYLALKSAGIGPGDVVLCNAFTLAPVPGALHNSGAEVIFVESEEANYTVDLHDLEEKAVRHKAKYLLLSHMRGHIVDMDALMALCERLSLFLIEDCAHTMGASWNGRRSGSFGHIACFSTQTYKHLNSGEGGLLITDDDEIMARAIIYSGSYMLYERHISRPSPEVFRRVRLETPNYSSRMDNLRASLLRVQLRDLDRQCERWNERYKILEASLTDVPCIILPQRPQKEHYVGSSIQFRLEDVTSEQLQLFLDRTAKRGVQIKWFGDEEPVGFTSSYRTWRFLVPEQKLPKTDAMLATMCDIRIPLTFSLADCEDIGAIIAEEARDIFTTGNHQ